MLVASILNVIARPIWLDWMIILSNNTVSADDFWWKHENASAADMIRVLFLNTATISTVVSVKASAGAGTLMETSFAGISATQAANTV